VRDSWQDGWPNPNCTCQTFCFSRRIAEKWRPFGTPILLAFVVGVD
jgi:hypothetical protein